MFKGSSFSFSGFVLGDLDVVRARCMFGQVPLLEFAGSALSLVQSWAIVRYIARESGTMPTDAAQCFRADACCEGVRDWFEVRACLLKVVYHTALCFA